VVGCNLECVPEYGWEGNIPNLKRYGNGLKGRELFREGSADTTGC
jgi:hypothetical protein